MPMRTLLFVTVIVTNLFSFGDALAKQNTRRIAALQQMVMEQNERIEGLSSLLEGLNASVAQLQMAQKRAAKGSEDNTTLKLIEDLGKMIDEIDRNYVRRDELGGLFSTSASASASAKNISSAQGAKKSKNLESVSASKLYSEGVRHFVKKRYDEAKKRFLLSARKGYKPAASNYYLGEISYYTKQYEDAIFYYKKSAGLYDKASYMDVLLLHTAISLDKKGQKEQAKIFYENVINTYPGKKAAAIAKKRLGRR